ncbi:MAG: hypothetical protein IPN78_00010 [Candidatus Accumulibacter sp.]|nr:hypothetical protein [Candidatus Accumulibacter propinquus]
MAAEIELAQIQSPGETFRKASITSSFRMRPPSRKAVAIEERRRQTVRREDRPGHPQLSA